MVISGTWSLSLFKLCLGFLKENEKLLKPDFICKYHNTSAILDSSVQNMNFDHWLRKKLTFCFFYERKLNYSLNSEVWNGKHLHVIVIGTIIHQLNNYLCGKKLLKCQQHLPDILEFVCNMVGSSREALKNKALHLSGNFIRSMNNTNRNWYNFFGK